MMHYLDNTISAIHEALVKKQVTPLELVAEALRRAHASNDNAFELILDSAIDEAKNLGEPEPDNLLWGIPYVAKDNFSTKGVVTTASSNILNGYTPLFDATVIERLHKRKAILIGKATLDELAMGGTGTTGHLGTTYNPYDPSHQRMIGGSSCGSAAVVASSIVPFALGSDTGDSVRKPASYAGLIGMKPTWGRISRYGLFPFAPSLDHVGFFTRSVKDSAIITAAIAGHDECDATSGTQPVPNYVSNIDTPLSNIKIAIITEIVESGHDPLVIESFTRLIEGLSNDGIDIARVNFRMDLMEALFPIYITIASAEATSNDANLDGVKFGPGSWGKTYEEAIKKTRTAGFSELIKRRFIIGSFALMRENQDVLFCRAQKGRRLIVDELNRIYEDFDIIMVPSTPSIAPKFIDSSNRLSPEYLIAENHLVLGNFAGLPAMTLPLGFKEGMPYGVHIMGRKYEETTLLKLAQNIEKLTGLVNLSARKETE